MTSVITQDDAGLPLGVSRVAVILPAAGSGSRFGAERNKLFARLGGLPLWIHAVSALHHHACVGRIVLAISTGDRADFETQRREHAADWPIEFVGGGKERVDSVRNGLQAVAADESTQWVAVHDAARPLVTSDDLDAVFTTAFTTGAAILASPVTSTVKQSIDAGRSSSTIDRSKLWLAQTPQVFRKSILIEAYRRHRGRNATDDAELVSRSGVDVALASGSADNLKITYPEDLAIAEAILRRRQSHNPPGL
ncbi:MAG: 2-C-methyl-D-erythritol 4-phosphate cytidylyltransferase [Planctomycetota bacterium]